MRILLASLMCLTLATSECFALKGGPIYPAGSNLVGTYAGVLQGVFDPTNPASSNSIGVFSLGVPSSGTATGSFVMFSKGRVFTGTAKAFADPRNASLRGILDATFDFDVRVPNVVLADGSMSFVTNTRTASVNGPISATVSTPKSSSFFSTTTAILRGDAELIISQDTSPQNDNPVVTSLALLVSGVKQSDTAPVF